MMNYSDYMNTLNNIAGLLEEFSGKRIFCSKEYFTFEKPLSKYVSAVCVDKKMVFNQVQIIDDAIAHFSAEPESQISAKILAGLFGLKNTTLSFLDGS